MITFEAQWIDVVPFLVSQTQPIALLKREIAHTGSKAWAGSTQISPVGEFWVPISSLLEPDVKFSQTKIGECVRVPMFAYDTAHRLLPAIFGLGIQIGMAVITEMMKHTRDMPLHVKLVLGNECTDLSPAVDCYRCYIGIAVQTK